MTGRSGSRPGARGGVALVAAICVALLALPGLAGAQTAGHAPLPPDMPGDRLLVSHRGSTGTELHTVALDGSDRRVLTSSRSDIAGAWSPDGRHVAFHRVEVGGDGLWVVTSEGDLPRRLADGGHSPSWAPDGLRVVHSPSTEARPVPLAITSLDGTTTPVPGTDGGIDPAWSPDGNQLAYVDVQRDHALVLVRVDGADRTVHLGHTAEPTWSPSSDRVAFVDSSGGGRPRLMLIDGAGSETFFLTDRFTRIQQLAYSPAGTHLAFAAAEGDGRLDIWTIRVADGHLQRLTDDPGDDLGPTWSASAELVALTRTSDVSAEDAPRDVLVVPSSGGPARAVTGTGADHAVAFAPGLSVRRSGLDRVATAVALSRTFDAADAVVIARADAYPDALAGAPLATVVGGPILLTGGDGLHPSLPGELARLGVETAYLLGGRAALSQQVEDDLADAGIEDVRRIAGSDRFATAARVADEIDIQTGGFDRVLVVEGRHDDPARGWPDALSASGVAAHTGEPILLVIRDAIPAETQSMLQVHSTVDVTIVGGTAAVSRSVAEQIDGMVTGAVERLSGRDRYETSTLAADLAATEGGSEDHPWLVTGRDWPDGIAAAPAAARDGGVLLLVDGRDPVASAATHAWLSGRDAVRGVLAGGTAAITPRVRAAVESSLAAAP